MKSAIFALVAQVTFLYKCYFLEIQTASKYR